MGRHKAGNGKNDRTPATLGTRWRAPSRLSWSTDRRRTGEHPAHQPGFAEGSSIPTRHAGVGVGDNISPALAWAGIPEGTAELVLIVQDPDAPLLRPVTHLIAEGIAPGDGGLPEGVLAPRADSSIAFGRGSFGRVGYVGPRPVRGHGPHRYVFQMFALDRPLSFPAPPGLAAVISATAGTVLSRGVLIGTYERN